MQTATITEVEFLRQVIGLAQLFGWRVAHFRPAQTKTGRWITAVQGDGKGFPDLVLVRKGRIVIAELKVGKNRTTPDQQKWLAAFREVQGVAVYEWRPCDWGEIESVLMG
jgi:hypothetical protein